MYVKEFFSLSSENIEKLSRLVPKFGYDGFGEIVFYRTYSRLKDGCQENWHDVVTRVINGTMSIRKDWYDKNGIEWDEAYWQAYAGRMAIALFNMYWLPAGRGMWAMGTEFIYTRGAMALNNCFSGDTKIIANQGIRTLRSLVGQKVGVRTQQGQKQAEVKSFGVQSLYNVTFKPHIGRSHYRQVHQATANHRWLLADGTDTTSLSQGDIVRICPNTITNDSSDYEKGFIHGLIFADGCNFYKDNYYIQLCGWKEKYRELLESSEHYSHTIQTENRMIFTSETALKAFPGDEENMYYKQGFFDGWRLFDGYYKKDTYCLDSTHPYAAQWLSDHSGFLNYVMVGHSIENADTNYGKRNDPLNRIKLSFEPVRFIVDSIVYARKQEEVFCVVEPETHSFMLAGGIITGNCGFTKLGGNDRLSDDLHWLMDALMLGVGVGFEPIRDDLEIYKPVGTFIHFVGDSREEWCGSWKLLIDAYTKPNRRKPLFDYSLVREKGTPIRGFGGLASGPGPLKQLFEETEALFETPGIDVVRLKTDLGNKAGVCVVAGNVRRSAELSKGKITDKVFLDLKDYELYPDREDWGYMSNNTVALYSDEDFQLLGEVAKRVITRGEPGIMNLKNFKKGRVGKKRIPVREDIADGLNPCGEIPLEDKELCNVVETCPTVCPNVETWYEACDFAAFYAATVSLLPTHRAETNRVVVRNRRTGVGIIDWTGWVFKEGLHKVTAYMRKGYDVVTRTNIARNSEAGVPESIRKTTIKPGGTGPKLPGRTPGIGYPTFDYTLRRMRVAANNPICPVLDTALVPFEPDYFDPVGTRVYEYPTLQGPSQPADQVSLWEQAMNLITVQREWSDNAVSNTLYFKPYWKLIRYESTIVRFSKIPDIDQRLGQMQDWISWIHGTVGCVDACAEWLDKKAYLLTPFFNDDDEDFKLSIKRTKYGEFEMKIYQHDPNHEEGIILKVLSAIAPHIKSCSLLPHSAKGAYRQMPEEGITADEYRKRLGAIQRIDWSLFNGSDGIDEKYCQGDTCVMPAA